MRDRSTLRRAAVLLLVLGPVVASCGDDDDATDATTTGSTVAGAAETTASGGGTATTAEGGGTETTVGNGGTEITAAEGDSETSVALAEGEVQLGSGIVVNTNDCPSDWNDTASVEGDEIRFGMTLPQSGPASSLGAIGDGLTSYMDYVNETDPIDGKQVTIILADDGLDPARTQTAVTEMIETEDIFGMVSPIGSANNLQVRPMLNEECIPTALASSGVSNMFAPTVYPWTVPGVIASSTEGAIWCQYISEELGEGTTVAGIFANNDTGRGFQSAVQECADSGAIDFVENVTYEPTASDISNEITTLAASDAEVLVGGVLGAFCSQTIAGVAASAWKPQVLLTQNCESIPAYFTPVDPAGEGVLLTSVYRAYSEEEAAANPELAEIATILTDAGFDTSASYMTGAVYGLELEHALRSAVEVYGGLSRTNLMKALWNFDFTNPIKREGIQAITDGANDGYMVEGAYVVQYHAPAAGGETGTFEVVSDLVSVEGEGPIDEDGEPGAP